MKNYSELGTLLTREEAKKIRGGSGMCPPGMIDIGGVCVAATGTRCVIYCCDHAGDCSNGVVLGGKDYCTSNEECQSFGIEHWQAQCTEPGTYVAGLCKG